MSIDAALTALDEQTGKGEILEALEKFYCPDCVFKEAADGSKRNSRREQHEFLSTFFGTLQGFNGATLHSSVANDNLSFSEWTFDMTAADGASIIWNEVLVRHWKDDVVVAETFYNASA